MQELSQPIVFFAVIATAAILALLLVILLWMADRRRGQARIEQLLQGREQDLREARRESVEKSRSSLKGRIAEQLAPVLPGFLYQPSDARFLGDPIDYIVFDGYTDMRDAGAQGMEIVLLEVKQGGSALSPSQKAIARCVQEGRVRFEICRIGQGGSVTAEAWRPGTPRGRAAAGDAR